MEDKKIYIIGGIIIGVLVLCICCLAVVGGLSFFTFRAIEDSGPDLIDLSSGDPTATPYFVQSGTDTIAAETLNTLENTIVPINDPDELAERLGGVPNVPATIDPPAEYYQTGRSDPGLCHRPRLFLGAGRRAL